MKHDRVPINTIIYTTLIKGFSKAYKLVKALEIFDVMKMSHNIKSPHNETDEKVKPNNVTYNSLIDCCIRCNNLLKG